MWFLRNSGLSEFISDEFSYGVDWELPIHHIVPNASHENLIANLAGRYQL